MYMRTQSKLIIAWSGLFTRFNVAVIFFFIPSVLSNGFSFNFFGSIVILHHNMNKARYTATDVACRGKGTDNKAGYTAT